MKNKISIQVINKELKRTLSVLKQALKEAKALTEAQSRKDKGSYSKKWLSLSNREDRIGNAYDSMKQLTERFNKEK